MDLHISLAAETLFHVGPIPVTNSMLTMFIVMAVVLLVFTAVARKAQAIPGRGQSVIELIIEFIMNLVEGTAGRKFGRQILPLITGIFIFIIFSNFSGLIPGMGTIGVNREEVEEGPKGEVVVPAASDGADHTIVDDAEATVVADVAHAEDEGDAAAGTTGEHAAEEEHAETHEVLVPFFRAPTADLNMTLALSLLTFTMVQIYGIRAHGVVGRIKHMANPPFLFPIEVISELSRILSLSARLFGNVFAGEVLLGVMYAMGAAIKIAVVPFLFPVIFMGLEVLFGTIQALVFALLTTIYITLAAAGHDDHDEEHASDHNHKTDDAHAPKVAVAGAGD